MQKCCISNFYVRPPLCPLQPDLQPRTSRGPWINFCYDIKISQNLILRWVYFIQKAKFQNFWSTLIQVTRYFRLKPISQKPGSRLFLGLLQGFQNGMSHPHSTKIHIENRILEKGLLPDQGPGGGPTSSNAMTTFLYQVTVKI